MLPLRVVNASAARVGLDPFQGALQKGLPSANAYWVATTVVATLYAVCSGLQRLTARPLWVGAHPRVLFFFGGVHWGGSPLGEAAQDTTANRCKLLDALLCNLLLSNRRWPIPGDLEYSDVARELADNVDVAAGQGDPVRPTAEAHDLVRHGLQGLRLSGPIE
eukprot:15447596-Alexandrium_andersonii.AAC.2